MGLVNKIIKSVTVKDNKNPAENNSNGNSVKITILAKEIDDNASYLALNTPADAINENIIAARSDDTVNPHIPA